MSIEAEVNKQRLGEIRVTMQEAAHTLAAGGAVHYYIEDVTKIAGRHGVRAVHFPKDERAIIELPNQSNHLIMALHAAEAILYGVKQASALGKVINIPQLEFVAHGQLDAKGKGYYYANPLLTVDVAQSFVVVAHKSFSSRDITVRELVQQFYEELSAMLSLATVLEEFPANILFLMGAGGKETKGKGKVDVMYQASREERSGNTRVVPADKINAMRIARESDE